MTINSWTENYGEDMFMDFDMSQLNTDQAYLQISKNNKDLLALHALSNECIKCPYVKIFETFSDNVTHILDTRHANLYRFLSTNAEASPVDSDEGVICELDENFGEFGVYTVQINEGDCVLNVLKEPVNIYFPILTVFLIYAFLALIPILIFLTKKYRKRNSKFDQKPKDIPSNAKRLKSLDTFRGISIVVMIFVNYGCGDYALFDHAVWNGLHLADLVFPWFMWIMGVCIPISVKSLRKRKVPLKSAILNVFRRSCILFALGLFLGASTNLNKLRVFGVLQRFGIAYFVVACVCLALLKNQIEDGNARNAFEDLLHMKFLWLVAIVFLGSHCLIVFLLPVPGCPKGYLGPGGYHENGKFFNCTGGATGYVDRLILGNHAYRYPTILTIYESQAFDPEGIVGCLTSIFQVFIGVQAGITLLAFKTHTGRIIRWLFWAALTGLVGAALCGFSKEGGIIPINKNLWSVSFVLVTSSFAFVLLSVCYVLIDVKGYWSGTPFKHAGMNAIIMYVGHSMTHSNFPIRWFVEGNGTHFLKLVENVWATTMWILVAAYLYFKNIFFSI